MGVSGLGLKEKLSQERFDDGRNSAARLDDSPATDGLGRAD